jgi:hypothetical protein
MKPKSGGRDYILEDRKSDQPELGGFLTRLFDDLGDYRRLCRAFFC